MNTENNNAVTNGSSNVLGSDAALTTDQSPDGIFSYDNRVPFWWKFLFCLLYTSPSPRDRG